MVEDVQLQAALGLVALRRLPPPELVLVAGHDQQPPVRPRYDPVKIRRLDIGLEHDLLFPGQPPVRCVGQRLDPLVAALQPGQLSRSFRDVSEYFGVGDKAVVDLLRSHAVFFAELRERLLFREQLFFVRRLLFGDLLFQLADARLSLCQIRLPGFVTLLRFSQSVLQRHFPPFVPGLLLPRFLLTCEGQVPGKRIDLSLPLALLHGQLLCQNTLLPEFRLPLLKCFFRFGDLFVEFLSSLQAGFLGDDLLP